MRFNSTLSGAALILVCSSLPPATVLGQSTPTPLSRISGTVVLDGVVDEPAWDAVEPLPMTMYSPRHRGEPSERTEIRLAHDNDYLYASGRFFTTDPADIRANSLFRDRWSGDDAFALFVDSFNDNQTVRRFTVLPAGTRIDELVGSDGADRNLNWNAQWDAATSQDDRGWYFEMRIPFSSLRFQERLEGVVMGMSVTRFMAAPNERLTFPDIDPQFGFGQPSEAHDFVLQGIRPSKPVYITPYLLAGNSRTPAAIPGQAALNDGSAEAGLDIKYSLSDNTFLDLSVNTDFAQVEADDQQVNLTRFPLFFPEKRQFFQERSDLFLFDMGSGGRLFHSRRIGLSADRRPVRILGGARLVGRLGSWDVGLLNMQSDEMLGSPGENFGVARVSRQIGNGFSRIGGIFTSRTTNDGELSLSSGVDGSFRFPNDHYATARVAMTDNEGDSEGASFGDRSEYYLSWERRASRGLRYWLRLTRAGEEFNPRLGFLPRRDFTHPSLYAIYATRGQQGDKLRSYGPGVIVNAFYGNSDNVLESLYAAHWWNYEMWNGGSGYLQVTHREELVRSPFQLGDGVTVPAGEHKFLNAWFYFQAGPSTRFRPSVSARYGSFYDGTQLELRYRSTWNLSSHLELSGEYEFDAIRFEDRGQSLNVHLTRLRARAALDTRLQATVLAQYNSVSDQLGLNLRVRYNFSEGTDLWLVYDEGLNTDRMRQGIDDRLPLSARRELALKFSYTFSP